MIRKISWNTNNSICTILPRLGSRHHQNHSCEISKLKLSSHLHKRQRSPFIIPASIFPFHTFNQSCKTNLTTKQSNHSTSSSFCPCPLLFQRNLNNHNTNTNTNSKSIQIAQPDNLAQQYHTTTKKAIVTSPEERQRLEELMPTHDSKGRAYTPYERCVRRLYLTNLFHPVKMGLDNMMTLHHHLNYPMNQPNVTVIHVAGSNGKGSVAYKVAHTLRLAGHNVGLFVSPHISSFRERMQVNNQPISEEEVTQYLPQIYSICEQNEIPATFFELTTALAFKFFQQRHADVIVLETGLGGRLDATNVISNPALSIITSIGLEHTRILGDTIELIAKEKAGIMKANRPVLVGPNCPHDVLMECAKSIKASSYFQCHDVLGMEDDDQPQSSSMKQNIEHSNEHTNDNTLIDYDKENSLVARAAIELLTRKGYATGRLLPVTEEHIQEGTSRRPPCRFEEFQISSQHITKCHPMEHDDVNNHTFLKNDDDDNIPPPVTVILDVAHNPPAMKLLVSKLSTTYPGRPMRIVVGFSSDKDLGECGRSLLSIVKDPTRIHLVQAAHPRAALIEDIFAAEPILKNANFNMQNRSVSFQVRSAFDLVSTTYSRPSITNSHTPQGNVPNGELLVVCGSVFLMAEAREALGFDEARDSKYIAEVAGSGIKSSQENFGNMDPEKYLDVSSSSSVSST